MQREDEPGTIRSELLERLRALEGPESSGTLAELAYRRAREALERALEESRNVRLQAIQDATATRERELTALMEAMRALRQAAETQIENTLRTAELESARLIDHAKSEAQNVIERASNEARAVRAEAEALRITAEERLRDIQQLEGEFNAIVNKIAQRIGIEAPAEGWWRQLLRRK